MRKSWTGTDCLVALTIIFIVTLVVLLNACVSAPMPQPKTCAMNVDDKACWTDKAAGDGRAWPEMQGWFCMSAQDMINVVQKVSTCK